MRGRPTLANRRFTFDFRGIKRENPGYENVCINGGGFEPESGKLSW
ncbi:hypothetical protein HMPREF0580_0888 [Mobiluncus mulieris ATCC 35239]|uniref:Uncharacterized protein n=1 Tax=Mobiluncus mulieris ATCC 35239 TaxID=871571 RepID=E0QPW1_9ACTO|nr:hypothetical protein HMPREF0577_0245 [Mobiluncus mulieris ATCC 35243]EFM46341.1 hypothetical protein HMPREF0580_0888 [Mobiluncus mulieris ATCC 35239]